MKMTNVATGAVVEVAPVKKGLRLPGRKEENVAGMFMLNGVVETVYLKPGKTPLAYFYAVGNVYGVDAATGLQLLFKGWQISG